MDFSIKAFDTKTTLAAAKAGVVAVAVFENKTLSQAAKALDAGGDITAALKSGDISGKAGSTLLLRGVKGVGAARVLLVGMGTADALSEKNYSTAIGAALKVFATLGSQDAIIAFPLADVKDRDVNWAVRALVIAANETEHRTDTQKSKKDPALAGVRKIVIAADAANAATQLKGTLAQAVAISNGMALTKELGNLSPKYCTTSSGHWFASASRTLSG